MKRQHTKDFLAAELTKAELPEMAAKAATGYYHDFLSPLATPCLQLASDLLAAGTPAAFALHDRHLNGEFDASKEESDEWAASEDGKAAFDALIPPGRPAGEQMGRIAYRAEGGTWVAYSAPVTGLKGAFILGSIAIKLVERADRKEAFMELMRQCFADLVEEVTGHRPFYTPPQPAPPGERSGTA